MQPSARNIRLALIIARRRMDSHQNGGQDRRRIALMAGRYAAPVYAFVRPFGQDKLVATGWESSPGMFGTMNWMCGMRPVPIRELQAHIMLIRLSPADYRPT
jgi:hypothetical protein